MAKETQKKTVPISSTAIDVEQSTVKNNNNIVAQKNEEINVEKLQTMTLDELYDTAFPPKMQIVENLLCAGAYLFVGSPKVGKSFFMAQLGYSISKGIDLWSYKVHRGTVLYLALEDHYARLQRRLSTMYGTESTDKFHLAVGSKNLNNGLDLQLEIFMKDYKDTKLIIIDTLQKIRAKSSEQFSYNADYDIVTKLKGFADKHNICVLVVHHTRKQTSEDIFDTISGSNGLLGAADGAFLMHKSTRITNKANLDMVGRDNVDQRLQLEFDRDSCLWKLIKAETEIVAPTTDPLLEYISKILTKEKPSWSGTARKLLSLIKETDLQPNTLSRKLNINVDRLLNEYDICYENVRTRIGSNIKLYLVGNEKQGE